MKDLNYNPNDYQGRREDQVESNESIAYFATIGLTVLWVLAILYTITHK